MWAREFNAREANLVRVNGNVAIVGDIHGQLYDLFYMLEKVKQNSRGIDKLVFMGDYVDRGMYGPEVVAYICAMKIEKKESVVMLRGNHETRACTEDFNFRQQCLQLYDDEVYEEFMSLFDNLPVAACVNGQYLAVHGGISEKLESFDHINSIERKLEPDCDTLVSDLLWSDPLPDNLARRHDFMENKQRGTACMFGRAPLISLLQESGYAAMIRAHEV